MGAMGLNSVPDVSSPPLPTQVTRLKREMEEVKTELAAEKQK